MITILTFDGVTVKTSFNGCSLKWYYVENRIFPITKSSLYKKKNAVYYIQIPFSFQRYSSF